MFLLPAEEGPGAGPAAALAAGVTAEEGGHQQGQGDDKGERPLHEAGVDEGQDEDDEQCQQEQVCHQAPGCHAVGTCHVLPTLSRQAGVPCCQGGGVHQLLRTEPHFWARPGEPPHYSLLVTQAADEAPGDGGGLATQRAGDGPGIILRAQQELQADSTEGVLAAQQLGEPGTAVGLPAHQALQVGTLRAAGTPSRARGVRGGGGFCRVGLGLVRSWLLWDLGAGHGGQGSWQDVAAQGLGMDKVLWGPSLT